LTWFSMYDVDCDGKIDFGEFRLACKDGRLPLTLEGLRHMFDKEDEDRSGYMDFRQFVRCLLVLAQDASKDLTERELAEEWRTEDITVNDAIYEEQLQKGREYDEDQKKEQSRIVDHITRNAIAVSEPWAIFMAGGPGSGKGHALSYLKRKDLIPPTVAHIDLDHNRSYLREWQDDRSNPKSIATVERTQIEAGFISELAAIRCSVRGKCFIYDATMRNKEWNIRFIQRLMDQALCNNRRLRVGLIFVDAALEKCQERVVDRAHRTRRLVQPDFVVRCHKEAKATAIALREKHDLVHLWAHMDNNGEPVFLADGASEQEVRCFTSDTARRAISERRRRPSHSSQGGSPPRDQAQSEDLEDGMRRADSVSNGSTVRRKISECNPARSLTFDSVFESVDSEGTAWLVEEVPRELKDLSPEERQRYLSCVALARLALGSFLLLAFSTPAVHQVAEIARRTGVKPFYVSYILSPLVSNLAQVRTACRFAGRRTSLLDAGVMNNTSCFGIFLAQSLIGGLAWEYCAETIAIVTIETVVVLLHVWICDRRKALRLWHGFAILSLYGWALVIVWVLENKFGID